MLGLARSWRPLQIGRNAVATNHPSATDAGIDILKAGGNAADAATAISLALGVCEPFMSGLGGDGFYHVFDGRSFVYEGTGSAPASASAERFRNGLPEVGPLSISPPGALAGLAAMHARHGRLPFRDVCTPAIALAANGVRVGHTYRRFASSNAWRIKDRHTASIYLNGSGAPPLGAVVVNNPVATTLERLSQEGAESFYRGDLAKEITADFLDIGSIVTAEDLSATIAIERQPMIIDYRSFRIAQTPPVSTGFTLLQELALFERFDPWEFRNDPAALIHVMVEIKKLAFVDRERRGGDPTHALPSPEDLLDPQYIDRLVSQIDQNFAADRPIGQSAHGDTTYFCVADAGGCVVSAIQSLNGPFGSGMMLPRTGLLMNNRMVCWHLEPAHPNCLAPRKKVRQTMNAPMVLRDGKPWAAFGTPGADNQVQINFQAAAGLIDFGLDPQQMAEAPRWSSDQVHQGANWPHAGESLLTVEASFPEAVLQGLADRGHALRVVPALEGPCSLEIIKIHQNGTKLAGSDPRRDGWARAFDQ